MIGTLSRMSARRVLIILSWLLLLGPLQTEAGPALDFERVRTFYNEGEFEKIKATLEDFLKKADKTGQTKEKIFAYKYLGVVYAAEPTSETRAEAYFYQLLKVAPNAHLSGMYASSHIENVFQKTRERVRNEDLDAQNFDEFGNPLQTTQSPSDGKLDTGHSKDTSPTQDSLKGNPSIVKKSGPKIWPWVFGGVGVLGAASIYYYLYQPERESNVIRVGP